jgi:thiol:disulfide interchange protein DsbD
MPAFLRCLLTAWLLVLGTAAQAQLPGAGQSVVTSERVRAELLAHAPQGVQPGQPLWVGLQLAHQPQWHTYWKNSGDSGLPTQIRFTLPAGITAGEIQWPVPKKIPIGTLANYGYEGTVLLAVPLTVSPEFKPSPVAEALEVKAQANWLVCKQECIPEEGSFTLRVPLRGSTAVNAAAFEAAAQALPREVPRIAGGAIPPSVARIAGDALEIQVQGLPVQVRGKQLQFFPETPEVIETAAAWTQEWKGAVWNARVPLSAQRSGSPSVMPVVLADGAQGWRAELAVAGTWPAVAAPATVSPALQEALRNNAANAAPAAPPIGLLAALLGALLGGIVLNLMPCVFPVLAIKVVGFAAHGGDRRSQRVSGLAYTAGVVLSFLALGGLMLGLRAAGEQLGWGFQLQSPLVVAALAGLFTLLALNFAGVFEFGSLLPSSLASMEARHPVANAFLSGVLAVAIASPCTAPFMGASLGLAVTLPAFQALLVFACLGAGMALPYLAASVVPAVARLLPRPGAWMDIFRRLMAFPMFATVAWLVWVLGQQSGIDGAGALLALLVALSLVVWTLTLQGRARWLLSAAAVAAFAAVAWSAGPQLNQPPAAATTTAQADGDWQPWSTAKVDQLVAAGQPVFVDFTAAWCVTCQYNKKTTLANAGLREDFRRANVALLRADWTRRDPAITAALASLGRSGVPVYVLYRKGSPPRVLSEVISVDEVRSALDRS